MPPDPEIVLVVVLVLETSDDEDGPERARFVEEPSDRERERE
jgi:hypothetical protein